MPKLVNPLTDIKIRNAKPKNKPYKLADGGGLYLEVMPIGSKLWRMKFKQTNGKESRLAFGSYPEISISEARKKRADARGLMASGIDPAKDRHQKKQLSIEIDSNTFEKIAREWHNNRIGQWQPQTAKNILHRLEQDVFPSIGKLPITMIKTPLMLNVIQQIEKRGALEVARRNAQVCSQIFRYAVVKGLIEFDPVAALKSELKPQQKSNHAAITVAEYPELLKTIQKNEGRMYHPNRIALRLMTLTFLRTSELIDTPWSEIDFENERWVIPWQRMKMGKRKINPRKVNHHVFLPKQGWALLRELHQITGGSIYLFPNQRDHERPVSNAMILAALKRMGYGGKMTGHGFRSLAKGTLKTLGYAVGDIELQLSHASGEAYGSAYDREEFLDKREKMMQHYADHLDMLEANSNVISFKAA